MWKKILEKLKNPPIAMQIVIYVLTILVIVGALLMLAVDYSGTWLEILAYTLFGLAGTLLAYSVFLLIKHASKIKNWVKDLIKKNKVTNAVATNFGYRTLVFAIISIVMGILYGIFNGVLSILEWSVWYLALAIYYILLTSMRAGIVFYQRRKLKNKSTIYSQHATMRGCGIALVVLNLALSVAVLQMIFIDRGFEYAGLLIYAAAAYAFLKITLSIINMVKSRKIDDASIKAIMMINLTESAVSIMALQTAMLSTFGDSGINAQLFNGITGSAVCLLTLGLGIYMIIKSSIEIKKLRTDISSEQQ